MLPCKGEFKKENDVSRRGTETTLIFKFINVFHLSFFLIFRFQVLKFFLSFWDVTVSGRVIIFKFYNFCYNFWLLFYVIISGLLCYILVLTSYSVLNVIIFAIIFVSFPPFFILVENMTNIFHCVLYSGGIFCCALYSGLVSCYALYSGGIFYCVLYSEGVFCYAMYSEAVFYCVLQYFQEFIVVADSIFRSSTLLCTVFRRNILL
jgi:hypothetical protein